MSFLSPLAFTLLALIPPIIALYLLKLRRQEYEVSSIYLWQRFVRDLEANAPWQRLRRNLLLLLQILLMFSLILALARPATETGDLAGQSVVLILDNSASMAATDVGGRLGQSISRLEAAKNSATDLVTNLPDEARVTVIAAAGGEAELLSSASQDRRQTLAAIAAVRPTAFNSDLGPALALAEAIVAREPQAEIVLISDGVVQLPPELAPIRFLPVGQTGANQAISALSVTPAAAKPASLFIQVSNYSQQAVQRRLVIEVDQTPFTVIDLNLPALGHVEQLVEALPATAATVEARLAPAESDMLALDDRAWAVVQATQPARAMLITPGNFFLQTALNLLNGPYFGANLAVSLIAPQDWPVGTSGAEPSSGATFHIFDGTLPATLPPGNLLFIAPPASVPGLFDLAGQISNPMPQTVLPDHPLLQNVSLAETQILTATVLAPAPGLRPLVAGTPAANDRPVPLLLAGDIAGRRVAVLTFNLHQSDLPLRPAFPILVANLVNYLAPGAGGLVPAELPPGQALALSLPAGANRLSLTRPDGQTDLFEAEAGRVTIPALTQPGLYSLSFGPAESAETAGMNARLAVNFFDPLESAIAPRSNLGLSGQPLPIAAAAISPAHREWWRPLAMGALALLVVEWLVYQRSQVLQLWHAIFQAITAVSRKQR